MSYPSQQILFFVLYIYIYIYIITQIYTQASLGAWML